MVNLFRRFQKPLMIVVTVVTSISFVIFYNNSEFMNRGESDRIGTIYGRKISQAHYMREGRKFDLAQALVPELWQSLIQPAMTEDEAMNNFIWNSMVLREESAQLGIQPSEDELETAIKTLPFFQTNGVYDSTKYNNIIQVLASRGMQAGALEEIVGDEIRLKRLRTLLGTTIAASPEDVRMLFEARNAKLQTQVIRFSFDDFLKTQQVSDEDLKKAYEERKATLQTEELRKVKYVGFTVENVDKPLVGKERVDAFQKLSEKAQDFMVAIAEPNAKFEEVAAKFGIPVKETPFFSPDEPPAELDKSPQAASTAFRLTKESPVSDAVQTEKGYFLLQFGDLQPARPKTFDEARTALLDTLKSERANEALTLKATEVRNKLEAELKAGKSFTDAAAAAGVKAEAFPPFSMSEPAFKEKDSREVSLAARELQPGQLSTFTPTMGMGESAGGGVLVYLEKKLPIDEKAFAESKEMTAGELVRRNENGVFQQWFRARRAAANVTLARARTS